jgi:predicted regulator of Ras-like GTPase activity (Roadblock/LC7/MglB family)
MPFLHWFRKKSRSTEAEAKASSVEKSRPEVTTVTEAASENSEQAGVPDTPSIEQQPIGTPVPATAPPELQTSPTAEPASTPHLSVPLGAFYEKLPPPLLAPIRPDLKRLIEIAIDDLVIDQTAQEATVPLSILSLSCPDIFVRPVALSDEIPITFSLSGSVPISAVELPPSPEAQPLRTAAEAPESGSPVVPADTQPEHREKTDEPLLIKEQLTKSAPETGSGQIESGERHWAPTVRATTASGKIKLRDVTVPTDELIRLRESEAGAKASASVIGETEFSGRAASAEKGISLRLQSVLSNFPPGLERPSIQALSGTQTEIVLPLDLIQSQLAQGRVVVPAATLCKALPNDLKPYFETIEPGAEIPIPLREIFLGLPQEAIKLREDQEIDHPQETIQTPFSAQAEEDAKRFGLHTPAATAPVPDQEEKPAPAEVSKTVSAGGLHADAGEQEVSSPPSPVTPEAQVKVDSERLQAIFLTDETLDLPKTIRKVGELPGLRSCLLNTTDGLKLAGSLDVPGQEQAVSVLVPELFEQARAKLADMHLGALETITLYCGRHQLSTFLQGNLCLTVLHDNRPFKPGVREKVQAVINELVPLSGSEKEL